MLAGATAGGLVGYIGSSVDGQQVDGTVLIDNCKISAKISSNYQTQASDGQAYGPLGGIVGLMCRANDVSVTIKDSTFNGSIDGYYGIGAAIGDFMSGAVKFEGTIDLADAKLNAAGHAPANRVAYAYCGGKDADVSGATMKIKDGEVAVRSCTKDGTVRDLKK